MAELATAAPNGDPREIATGSTQNLYTLRGSVGPSELFTFRQGALVGIRAGETFRKLEVVLDGTPRADLEIVGIYDGERGQIDPVLTVGPEGEALDDFGASIREKTRDGDLGNFDTGPVGPNQILAQHIGQPCYAKNDNTLWLTDDGGTLSFAGLVAGVNSRGKVTLRNTFDIRQQWKQIGAAIALGSAAPSMQAVDATLVAGTVTISTGITVAANSEVVVQAKGTGTITGSVNFADLCDNVASRVVGLPGVGTLVIEALADDGTLDADAAGTVRVVILTPQA